jgi:hypothetical protein
MSRTRPRRSIIGAAAGGAGLVAVYLAVVRPRTMRWGATDEEVNRPLPGDDLVARPGFSATRAITIRARPEHIWPWLVQMGSGRAGWYAYDRIDNGGVPSAQRIIPGLQRLQAGDRIPMLVGKEIGPLVKELEPNRRMLWWDGKGEFTWEWLIQPIAASTGDIVMVRKQLRGIKARAERLARSSDAAGRPRTRTAEVAS